MQEYLEDSGSTAQPFGHTHMKTKIREHFSEINGKPNIATFRSTAETILHEFHVTSKKVVDRESEKNNIIQTAASLIKNDIKAMKTSNDNYPHIDNDMETSLDFLPALYQRNPFTSGPNLSNVMNGVNADNSVNVDNAKVIGEKILTSMTGKPVGEYSFKKNAQAVTLASKSKVGIDNDIVQVDPRLLFQRLVLACNNSDDMKGVFMYELCSYPTALFDSQLTLRQPQKPALADALWAKLTNDATSGPSDDVRYVLDGGALLHRIPWRLASRITNLQGGMHFVLQVCDKKVWYTHRRV